MQRKFYQKIFSLEVVEIILRKQTNDGSKTKYMLLVTRGGSKQQNNSWYQTSAIDTLSVVLITHIDLNNSLEILDYEPNLSVTFVLLSLQCKGFN